MSFMPADLAYYGPRSADIGVPVLVAQPRSADVDLSWHKAGSAHTGQPHCALSGRVRAPL